MTITIQFALVGDSDIAFWPVELYPQICDKKTTDISSNVDVSGHSGATLGGVVPHVGKLIQKIRMASKSSHKKEEHHLVVVGCAGENDIGDGLSLDTSVACLEQFLNAVFLVDESSNAATDHHTSMARHVVFLGPKFEPWLENEPSCKKSYSKMSRSFSRCCRRHPQSENIHYVDCLTMFCSPNDTAGENNDGVVVLGTSAHADPKFFSHDQLHLNSVGYEIWKQVVEDNVKECILKGR